MLKSPGFAAIALLSACAGELEQNSAIFSLVNTVLLRNRFQSKKPGELVSVFGTTKRPRFRSVLISELQLIIATKNEVFSGLLAFRFCDDEALARMGQNERTWGYLVSGNYF